MRLLVEDTPNEQLLDPPERQCFVEPVATGKFTYQIDHGLVAVSDHIAKIAQYRIVDHGLPAIATLEDEPVVRTAICEPRAKAQ